jgi:hypothetical protein
MEARRVDLRLFFCFSICIADLHSMHFSFLICVCKLIKIHKKWQFGVPFHRHKLTFKSNP